MTVSGRYASITGDSTKFTISLVTLSGYMPVWNSALGTLVTFASPVLSTWDIPEYTFYTDYSSDWVGRDIILSLAVVVLGE
jgi:hypothetical protein